MLEGIIQIGNQFVVGGEPPDRIISHGASHHGASPGRDPGGGGLQGDDLSFGLAQEVGGHGFLVAGRFAGQGVVKGGPEGVHVRAEILGVAFDGFRGHVVGRGPDFLGLGGAALAEQQGQTEIHDFGVALGVEQDVTRLDVAVDQAGPEGGLEALRHLDGQRQHFPFRDGAALFDLVFEMAADHQFHRDVIAIKRAAGGEHPHHMGMAEGAGDPRLLFKSIDPAGVRGIVFVEDFDRHLAVQRVVLGHEDHAHAADRMPPQQRVGPELAFHPGVLAAVGARHIGKRPHRRDIHRASTRMAISDLFRTLRHGLRLAAHCQFCKLESCRGRFS